MIAPPGKRIPPCSACLLVLLLCAVHSINAQSSKSAAKPSHPAPQPASDQISKDDAAKVVASDVVSKITPVLDVQAKSKEVMDHLSAVIRNYRTAVSLVQKVGEPSDSVYREQSIANAKLVASYAFQASDANAVLLNAYAGQHADNRPQPALSEARRMQFALANVDQKTQSLQAQQKTLEDQLDHAHASQASNLRAQLEQVQGALQLNLAMSDALGKIAAMSDTHGQSGFAGDIEQLKQTVPGITDLNARIVPVPLAALDAARSAGVTSQAAVFFELLQTRQALDQRLRDIELLHHQALALRTPLTKMLQAMIQEGQALSQAGSGEAPAPPSSNTPQPAAAGKTAQTTQQFDQITAGFKTLSASAVPLSEEIIALEESRANLTSWRTAVNREYAEVLRSLLQRIVVIVLALAFVLIGGEIWRRATNHYVHDLRRRRQLLAMRRMVVFFLCGLVVVFGFVSQFNSLATFAGFITAGLAVGLQTILLSVAAYFFIVGRYGVRVGDRITVAGVTGDVIEVGLVRFYVMELAASVLGFKPTGRVAVFSNAVLFQAGTPLYKQLPGTDYTWYEMTAVLKKTSDYNHAAHLLLGAVEQVYGGYKQSIEQQHQRMQSAVDTSMNAPRIESVVQFIDDGPQFTVRFPVALSNTSHVSQEVTDVVLKLIQADESVREALTAVPIIKSDVKL